MALDSEVMDAALSYLWELASNKLRNRPKVVNRLEEALLEEGITKKSLILDVAGGFGFPSIDLAKRGYQIVYNDGSHAMYEQAVKNVDRENAPAYVVASAMFGIGNTPWQEFDQLGASGWNALLCMGNSLPYVDSWGKRSPDLCDSSEHIIAVLRNFNRLLVPGGILYIDKQPERQDHDTEDIGVVNYKGRRVHLTSQFYNDKANRVRHWKLVTKDDETETVIEYPSQGRLLLEDEFVSMLHKVGFREVKKKILEGEIYEGFVARKG